MASVNELLDRFVQLFNESRFEEAEKDFAPGGYGEEIGTGRRFTPQEGTANSRAWRQAFPDAQGTITRKMIDGTNAVLVIETNGSAIIRASHYIDVAGMMAQLGAAGAAAGGR